MYQDIDHKDPAHVWSHPTFVGIICVVAFVLFFSALAVKYVGDWMQPQTPTWLATYEDTNCPDWCARGYVNGTPCDIVEAPYKDGHLYQIWYDHTVFYHYESEYRLPTITVFTNGDWSLMVEVEDFK